MIVQIHFLLWNTKKSKFIIHTIWNQTNYLCFGLRWENSNIDVNLLTTSDLNNKDTITFPKCLFFTTKLAISSASVSYSRKFKTRGRFLNPFGGLSNNTNIFVGNQI
jgi:hypothetical protein